MNFVTAPITGRMIKSCWFPLVAQALMLGVFILIIIGGWGIQTKDPTLAKILRNTNLSNLLVWSYWWPLIIVSAILFGRFWCTVCPMELVSFIASKVGLKRSVPAFFRSGWVVTLFYAGILLVGVHTLAIHRQPHRMAIYMLILLGVAVISSLLFKKRAFCSYICPIGHLLGVYALLAPFQWRAADTKICTNCKNKDCVDTKKQGRLIGRSCTSNLFPPTIPSNQNCLLCLQCAKVCPNNNLSFSPRRLFADLFTKISLTAAQQVFVVTVSGFVVYEILSEWTTSKALLIWVPNYMVTSLSLGKSYSDLVSAVVMFVIFPAALYIGVWFCFKALSKNTTGSVRTGLSLLLLPIMAAAHVLKACLKMTSRIPYWSHVGRDPRGVDTATAILDKTLVLDETLSNALQPGLTWLALILLAGALSAILLMLKRNATITTLDQGGKIALLGGAILYWAVFAVMIVSWRF